MMVALIGMILMMSVMPGPATAAIFDITWSHGRRMGFVTALGGSVGVALYTLLALLIGTFLSGEGLWVSVLEGVGAIYLATLGLMALIEAFTVTPDESQITTSSRGGRVFVIGLMSTCLSPKTALFYLVILSQFDFQLTTVAIGIAIAGLTHIVVRIVWYGTWIHLIHPLRFMLDGPWLHRSMKLVTGTLLMALSLHIML